MDTLQAMYGDVSSDDEEEEEEKEPVVNDLEVAAAYAEASLEEETALNPVDENAIDLDDCVVTSSSSSGTGGGVEKRTRNEKVAPDLLAAAAAAADDERTMTQRATRNAELEKIRQEIDQRDMGQQGNHGEENESEEDDDDDTSSSTSSVELHRQAPRADTNGEDADIVSEEDERDHLAAKEPIQKPRTKHEILPDEKEEEPLQISVDNINEVVPVGHVMNVIPNERVVLVEGIRNSQALDEGSVLCLKVDTPNETGDMRRFLRVIGGIDEVFGPVHNPFYIVRMRKQQMTPGDASETLQGEEKDASTVPLAKLAEIETEMPIFALQDYMKYVDFTHCFVKGSDASNMHDEEPAPEEIEYSDDEEEAAVRAQLREMKKKSKQSEEDLNVENAEEAMGNVKHRKRSHHNKKNPPNQSSNIAVNLPSYQATSWVGQYPVPSGMDPTQQAQMIQQMQTQMAQMQAHMQYQEQILQRNALPPGPQSRPYYSPGGFHLFSNVRPQYPPTKQNQNNSNGNQFGNQQ